MRRQYAKQRLDVTAGETSETFEPRAEVNEQDLLRLEENEQQRKRLGAILNPSDQRNIRDVQTVLIKEEPDADWRPGVDLQDPEFLSMKEEEEPFSVVMETDTTRTSSTKFPLENGEEFPADVQTVLIKEESAEDWRSGVDQLDAESFSMKDGDEEQFSGMETDTTRTSFNALSFQPEEDEPQLSLHYRLQTEDLPASRSTYQTKAARGGEGCKGADITRNPHLNPHEEDSSSSVNEVSEDDEDDQDGNNSNSRLKLLSDFEPNAEYGNKVRKKRRSSQPGVNTVNKSFLCSDCGKPFLHKRSLQRHLASHSGIKSSRTLANKKCVGEKKNVDSHRKDPSGQKSLCCDYCGKIFNMKSNLNSHVRIHTGERPYACDICGQRFSQKPHLNTHARTHTGEKPFVCDVCGQRFSRKTHLDRHMRVHTGQKPFTCDVCGQTFSQSTSLNTHTRIHTGLKPFSCEICGQRFSQKTKLNTHMRIHTGQKPFACDICGRRFSDKRNLNTHMRIHTGQKPFACNICGQRFSIKTNLKRHIRIHTGSKALN
ncbi:zinc finger protein 879 [Nothobranchius furzeri]|uniref:Zinc finger protein 436-like n=2 Tax=Nothobranchius furzeri TaxID=105023 RepID=A0A8C6L3K6_NOTFU|nr:zinc finger protein 436-like [Nothobranchius furzeri]